MCFDLRGWRETTLPVILPGKGLRGRSSGCCTGLVIDKDIAKNVGESVGVNIKKYGIKQEELGDPTIRKPYVNLDI